MKRRANTDKNPPPNKQETIINPVKDMQTIFVHSSEPKRYDDYPPQTSLKSE